MKFVLFLIDRPIFAAVMSIVIVILGALSYVNLPVTQYPEVAPPTIVVEAQYPGAQAQVIADTVATPIEQEVNGVENMLYMSSQSTSDGLMRLTITFKLGTDLEQAQVQVQNRVAIATQRLPEPARRIGVVTRKNTPDILMVVHLISPDQRFDQLYITNYAQRQVRDVLARLDGVGDISVYGARDYSMRVWLDPDRMASLGLTAGDVIDAVREQNAQVASGSLGQPPVSTGNAFEISLRLEGRLRSAEEFENIVVNTTPDGRFTRLGDVARVELGARDYSTAGFLDSKPAVVLAISQRPGSNALATADSVFAVMDEVSRDFPEGLEYRIVYNPTEFIAKSIDELLFTIVEAVALVMLVILLFLQTWRASIIPLIAIPVSLIGTFAVMSLLGFSINTLTLFGLVLAVGIVVDDAIVVVENVQRNIASGLSPRDAARRTMEEVGGALVAIGLVLTAVFVPVAFLTGITGEFYRQFALTIAVATVISVFNSLTLSPALAALLQSARQENEAKRFAVFAAFDRGFTQLRESFARALHHVLKRRSWMLLGYGVLLVFTAAAFLMVPRGFVPEQMQGYFIVLVDLPQGASTARTEQVVTEVEEIILETPGMRHTAAFVGLAAATGTFASNSGTVFTSYFPSDRRPAEVRDGDDLLALLRARLAIVQEANVTIFPPPPIRGIGNIGGFSMRLQDRAGRGTDVLLEATNALVMGAYTVPGLTAVYTPFSNNTPQLFIEIDRVKAEMLDVPVENVFEALEVYMGSVYINDFNLLGRSYRVIAQADSGFRIDKQDIARLHTRSNSGAIVPLGSFVEFREIAGPNRVPRYNLYPAAEINGDTLPGFSTGEAIAAMERLAREMLPDGITFEWTELAFQQVQAANTAIFIFPLSVLFVFLALAALYESWSLPLAIIMIVPLCLSFSLVGIALGGFENDVLTQIGFIVLIGLASKNAILVVEFARRLERDGRNRFEAAREAARLRLRPILMTSLAFILGVMPLMFASGAGHEMRQSLGTAVFSGMLGVTVFGLFFTPVFYVFIRGWVDGARRPGPAPATEASRS